jgi:hypothetical protein
MSSRSDWNPERLMTTDHEGGDEEGLDFLRGALKRESREAIDPARLERIGRAVVVATAAPPIASAISSSSSSSSASSAGSSVVASKVPNILLALGMIGGMAVVASFHPTKDVAQHRTVVATTQPDETATPLAVPAEIKTISPNDLPSAPSAASVHTVDAPKPPPSAVAATITPTDEIALLARAHDALRSDPTLSLSLCREHAAKVQGSQFAQEREAVAIEALVYLGRKDEARTRFRSFEERYPASSHRVHLENLLH